MLGYVLFVVCFWCLFFVENCFLVLKNYFLVFVKGKMSGKKLKKIKKRPFPLVRAKRLYIEIK